jgi:hypothetical protein
MGTYEELKATLDNIPDDKPQLRSVQALDKNMAELASELKEMGSHEASYIPYIENLVEVQKTLYQNDGLDDLPMDVSRDLLEKVQESLQGTERGRELIEEYRFGNHSNDEYIENARDLLTAAVKENPELINFGVLDVAIFRFNDDVARTATNYINENGLEGPAVSQLAAENAEQANDYVVIKDEQGATLAVGSPGMFEEAPSVTNTAQMVTNDAGSIGFVNETPSATTQTVATGAIIGDVFNEPAPAPIEMNATNAGIGADPINNGVTVTALPQETATVNVTTTGNTLVDEVMATPLPAGGVTTADIPQTALPLEMRAAEASASTLAKIEQMRQEQAAPTLNEIISQDRGLKLALEGIKDGMQGYQTLAAIDTPQEMQQVSESTLSGAFSGAGNLQNSIRDLNNELSDKSLTNDQMAQLLAQYNMGDLLQQMNNQFAVKQSFAQDANAIEQDFNLLARANGKSTANLPDF